jgi:superfamily I DNA/RNA helicase
VPKRRIGQESIQKMEEQAHQRGISLWELIENHTHNIDLPSTTKKQVEELAKTIKECREKSKKDSIDKVLTDLLHQIKYKDYLLANNSPEEAEEKLQNIGQLINMASKF